MAEGCTIQGCKSERWLDKLCFGCHAKRAGEQSRSRAVEIWETVERLAGW